MTLNVRVSGSVWSSLIFDNVRQQGDKEGFLIGEVSMQEMTNISDSQMNKTTRETTVNVISHTICPKPFSFYNRCGEVESDKLERLLKDNQDNVVGWFRCRSGSTPEPSLREITIHHHLREIVGAPHQTFIFGIYSEDSNANHTTITYYYNYFTYANGLFLPQKVSIENLGDTAQSEYKHGSSLNTESSGSDSYREILTSHKKDMIDKDGYLQGMQGIQMTNEAIHDKMKSLKDSVVESEESVKKLATEIKMLRHSVIQTQKAAIERKKMQTEPFPDQTTKNEIGEELSRLPKRIDSSEVDMDEEEEVNPHDPFSSLIMDMKASISSPVKPRSNSDQLRKGPSGDISMGQEEERKLRSNSSGVVNNSVSFEKAERKEGLSQESSIRTITSDDDDSECDSTQLPDSSTRELETSNSQTF